MLTAHKLARKLEQKAALILASCQTRWQREDSIKSVLRSMRERHTTLDFVVSELRVDYIRHLRSRLPTAIMGGYLSTSEIVLKQGSRRRNKKKFCEFKGRAIVLVEVKLLGCSATARLVV